MESRAKSYEVILTEQGKANFKELWESLVKTHSLEQAEKKIDELYDLAMSLSHLPERGVVEEFLRESKNEYRFLVYNIVKRRTVKIIYRIEEDKVYIIDFFPCQMSTKKLIARSREK